MRMIFVLVLFLVVPSMAQGESWTVQGTVVDVNRKPVAGVKGLQRILAQTVEISGRVIGPEYERQLCSASALRASPIFLPALGMLS